MPVGADPAAMPGRNGPCPCGSGRKFKLCCGANRSRRDAAGQPAPLAALPSSGLAPRPAGGEAALGPLTELGELHTAAEEFWRGQVGLAAPQGIAEIAAESGGITARRRIAAAERHRGRGVRLAEAGRRAAAIAAFRQAVRLNPQDAAAHRLLGGVLLQSGRLDEAVESLRLATALKDDAGGHYNLAVALRRRRLNDEAVAAYRRAIELAPDLIDAHLGLADLLELVGGREEAAQSLRRAAALTGATSRGRLYLARALLLDRDFATAEIDLRAAIALDPQDDLPLKHLGNVLAWQGRFDEAVDAFDRSLALNPRQFAAHFTAVEARKCSEADRPRLAQMRQLLADPSLADDDRLLLHFAAGKLLDDLGDYEAAMLHFETANRIRRQYATFDGAAFGAAIDRLVLRYSGDFFAASPAFGTDDETPLLIVGMPRSGTTLVEQILSSHPAIAAGGELPFWIRWATVSGTLEATYLTPLAGHQLAQQYLAILRGMAPDARRVTDKLPFNLLCVGLIHLLLPKARFVLCRRHPVDTCLSIYFTYFLETIAFASDRSDLVAAYREYRRLANHWRAVLPPERFLEIDYQELIADREAVTRRLIAFAGLDWNDGCLWPERNSRPVVTASVWQARQPVYANSLERWRRYEPWLGELRQLMTERDADPQAAAAAG